MNFPKRQEIRRLVREQSSLLDTLDDGEKEIVRLIVDGATDAKMRQQLGMTQSVLEYAKQGIHKKLGIHSNSRSQRHARAYQTAGERLLYNSWLDKFEK